MESISREYTFEYEKDLQDYALPWYGHKFFAYDLVKKIKPTRIVELGTYRGTSFFAFCQSAKDAGIESEINAIDCWEGDKHSGFYDDEIYNEVKKILATYYKEVKTNLHRMKFDDAVDKFSDNSVDLLHIDGLHTYEAVKGDYEKWLPKMTKDGVIIIHDIVVTKDDFGVHKFWDEIKMTNTHLEFFYSYGLGVIFLGDDHGLASQKDHLHKHYSFVNKEKDSKNLWYVGHQKQQEINALKKKIDEMQK